MSLAHKPAFSAFSLSELEDVGLEGLTNLRIGTSREPFSSNFQPNMYPLEYAVGVFMIVHGHAQVSMSKRWLAGARYF